MENQQLNKLASYDADPSTGFSVGGYDNSVFSKYQYDEDFQRYKKQKYGQSSEEVFQPGGYEEMGFKSQDEEDRAEYDKKVNEFASTSSKINKINNTHMPLAWSLRNIDNDRARSALDVLSGKRKYSDVQKQYDDNLFKLSAKYGVNVEDIEEWRQRDWRGAITATTEVMNDMRDVAVKAGIATTAITATSAVVGAGLGSIGGGVGAAPGAIAGARTGMQISGKTVFPAVVFQDTFTKEAGNMAANYLQANPNISDSEMADLKKMATSYGVGAGLLEAGMAAFLGPYIGKTLMAIPGARKITAPLMAKAVTSSSKQFSKFLSTEAGKAFLVETAKITGAEITTEEAQYFLELATTEYVRANAEIELEEKINSDDISPEERLRLTRELESRKAQQQSGSQILEGAGKVALSTIQATMILAPLGAGASVKARVHNQIAKNINKEIDSANAEAGIVPEEKAAQRKIEMEEVENQEVMNFSPEQLQKTFAEQNIKVKDIENQISSTQTRIENSKDLGLPEAEVTELKLNLEKLTQQKEMEEVYLKKIGTERAIKQAEKQTDAELEKVNQNIEKTSNNIEATQSKIEVAKKEGKDTSSLETKLTGYENQLGNYEATQEKLMQDKVKLEKREDVESVLQGKKTVIPSKTLASIENKNDTKINKVVAKNAQKKIDALIKSEKAQADKFVRGFEKGIKTQVKETKDIRKALYSTLREAGIKRAELSNFDSLAKNVVTVQDLINSREKLTEKVQQVFEQRNKTLALKMTDKLRSLAKPLKAGKAPKGKMTADIQNKVNRLLSFTNKKMFEIGFNIEELYQKYETEPGAKLQSEEQKILLTADNNARIKTNQEKINELKSDEVKSKIKWEGGDTKREGRIEVEQLDNSVDKIEVDKPEGVDTDNKVEKDVKHQVTNLLNIINMGFDFKELSVKIADSVFTGKNLKEYNGKYSKNNKTIEVRGTAEFSLAHEIGHYFDNKLNSIFDPEGNNYFSTSTKIEDPSLKSTMEKFNTMVKAERARTQQNPNYKKLDESDKNYIGSSQEIFARAFHALSNKINKTQIEKIETPDSAGALISEMTRTMPTKTLNDFKAVLDSLANYKEVGAEIRELELQNAQLEKQNKRIEKNLENFSQMTLDRYLPETIADLVFELEIAGDLKSKTSEQIMRFNEYAADLIYEGRDARQEKAETRKKEREDNIRMVLDSIEKLAPKNEKTKGVLTKLTNAYAAVGANWQSMLNLFFGKDTSEKFTLISQETDSLIFNRTEKEAFTKKAMQVFGVQNKSDMSSKVSDYLKEESTYVQTIKEEKINVKLNKMQILSAWIYSQNDIGKSRLMNMFGENQVLDMFSKLDNRDMSLGQLLIETASSYYDQVNTIFREERGIDLPQREGYFPLATEQEVSDLPSFMDASFGVPQGLPSFTKSVAPSKNVELRLGNPISILFTHIQNVGDYIHLQQKTNEINMIFKDPRVRASMKQQYGAINSHLFSKFLETVSVGNRIKNNSKAGVMFEKLASNYVVAKIALKPAIMAKQLLSFVNYMEDIPVSEFMKYQKEFFKDPKGNLKFMMEDPYLNERFYRGSEVFELSDALETSTYSKSGKFLDFLTLNVRVGDIGAIVLGGYPQVRYLMDVKGMSKEQAFKTFRKSTADSQQFSSTSSLSLLQNYAKMNGLTRMFFAFTNTPYQYHRKVVDSIIRVSRGEISKKQAAKTLFIYQALNPIMYNWATSLSPILLAVGILSGDEDRIEEASKQFFVGDMLGGVLVGNSNLIPLVSDVPQDIFNLAVSGKTYGPDTVPFAKELKNMLSTGHDLLSSISDMDFEDIDAQEVWDAITDAGEIWKGLPLEYTTNAIKGGVNLFEEEKRLEGVLKMYGISPKKAKTISEF